ncbi:MAG: hypothetical protein GXP42_10030 [Chloroflexi bacterium]|nr:hypothetical protein [Chloroflexota bacterium]
MQVYRVETMVLDNRTLVIKGLPFEAGEEVEVIVRRREESKKRHQRYPLRGAPIRYEKPFESVAETEWEALQ